MTKKRFAQFSLVLALLSLAVPAMALPRPCDAVCDCDTPCIVRCTINSNIVTSCGSGGVCVGRCLAAGAVAKKPETLLAAIYAEPSESVKPASATQELPLFGYAVAAQGK